MTDKNDYRRLLGERIARANLLKNEVEPPAAEDIACWKRLALAKKQERKRRLRNMATLASVLAVACCASLVPLFHIPDAQAGKDSFVDVEDFREDGENMAVDVYRSFDDLPLDVLEDFYIFDNLPAGFVLSEIRVSTVGDKKECRTELENERGETFVIRQNLSDSYSEVIVNSDYQEKWFGRTVHVKEYSDEEERITFRLAMDNGIIIINADRTIDKSIIQQTIKEAFF